MVKMASYHVTIIPQDSNHTPIAERRLLPVKEIGGNTFAWPIRSHTSKATGQHAGQSMPVP
jgi:hypothetical protein